MDKLISIIIPTFNRKELTDNAIFSVLSTSPKLLEIIVVDDCSSIPYFYDNQINASEVSVRTLRLLENVGAGMARKIGVENAQGTYIAFLDSDDCYDPAWLDYVVAELILGQSDTKARLIFSGVTSGEKRMGGLVRSGLSAIPKSLLLVATRVVVIFFNPFYTPSIVMHKDLCKFKNGLRYCEDYYSIAAALFRADLVVLANTVACHLGREPNSAGGQSSAKAKMYWGEMEVRRAMFGFSHIAIFYMFLIPFGMIYQILRTILKRLIGLFRIYI